MDGKIAWKSELIEQGYEIPIFTDAIKQIRKDGKVWIQVDGKYQLGGTDTWTNPI